MSDPTSTTPFGPGTEKSALRLALLTIAVVLLVATAVELLQSTDAYTRSRVPYLLAAPILLALFAVRPLLWGLRALMGRRVLVCWRISWVGVAVSALLVAGLVLVAAEFSQMSGNDQLMYLVGSVVVALTFVSPGALLVDGDSGRLVASTFVWHTTRSLESGKLRVSETVLKQSGATVGKEYGVIVDYRRQGSVVLCEGYRSPDDATAWLARIHARVGLPIHGMPG